MVVTTVEDSTFYKELAAAGNKVVAVEFFATWSEGCRVMSPVFENLSKRFTSVVFLKVDVDSCPQLSATERADNIPMFGFYKHQKSVMKISTSEPQALEDKLKELAVEDVVELTDTKVKGHIDLVSLINKSACECLNDSDEHPFPNCIKSGDGYLESDCDEQLILSYGFYQAVKLHSLKIKAPRENGPKTMKLFINLPRTLDFDQADSMEPVQLIELKPDDLTGENPIPLRYVKFQNVQNLQIFVKDNQGNSETTCINHLAFIGSPINMTNMSDFKRVTGKKGESH